MLPAPRNTHHVDLTVAGASADDFGALLLPGGTTNPDQLRLDHHAVALVKAFVAVGKPVAAICHGPWTLIEADVVGGKTLVTSRNPGDLGAFVAVGIAVFV